MATSAYHKWVAAGRPFQLATPVVELKALAKRYGITFLGDIGADDASHLQASFPEDHCPFSVTAWPVPLPGYVVCAIDLANQKGLGAALLRDAKAGKAPWLKYLNFAGRNYSLVRNWQSVTNSDEHVHISIRSDWIDRSIGAYDPFAGTTTSEGDDMTPEQAAMLKELHSLVAAGLRQGPNQTVGGVPVAWLPKQFFEVDVQLDALKAAVAAISGGNVDVQAILAGVDARLAKFRADHKADVRDAVADGFEGGATAVRADAP